jgi:Leucine-rich repeat (LRR) protein
MKSFSHFISESLENNHEYEEIARMLVSEDPYESYYASEQFSAIYSDDEKRLILSELINILSNGGNLNSLNPYDILIMLEDTFDAKVLESLDYEGGPFEAQFELKEHVKRLYSSSSPFTFRKLINMRELNIYGDLHFHENTFRGLTKVEQIYMYGKRLGMNPTSSGRENLERISKNLFKDCINLESLAITRFNIDLIESGAFEDCEHLKIIQIGDGKIGSIERDAFKSNSIEEMLLSNCSISSLPTGAFINCTNLRVLDLSRNQLTTIEPNTFNSSLFELHLSSNLIEWIEPNTFTGLSNLQNLDLSSNPLKRILVGSFTGLTNLTHFIIAGIEDLELIERGAFRGLKTLRAIDAIGTQLTDDQYNQVSSEVPGLDLMTELPF